jgi:hypothetical protein
MGRALAPRVAVWGAILFLLAAGLVAPANAGVLSAIPVNGAHAEYEAGSDGANGYGAATIARTTVPAGTSACTTGTKTIPLAGGSTSLVFSATTGGTVCTAGDFSEEFTLAFSSLLATQTNTFVVTTAAGGGPPGIDQEAVTLGVLGLPLPMTATVHIYVDYGSATPPSGGIDELDLAIT